MKSIPKLLQPVAVFAGAMAVALVVRMAWVPRLEVVTQRVIPAGVKTSDGRPAGALEELPEVKLSALRSVTSGLVVLPLDATPETVAAAFARAWTKLSADPRADIRLSATQLFSDWLKVDPDAAIRFVSEPPGFLNQRGGEYLLATLAELDPERACQIALKSGLTSNSASGAVMKVWGSRDPVAALAHAAGLPSHQRLAAEMNALTGWAAVSGTEAFAWLESQPAGWRRDQLMNKMAVCMLQCSPGDMVRLMQQGNLPPEMVRGLHLWQQQSKPEEMLSTVQAALAAGGNVKDLLRVFAADSFSELAFPDGLPPGIIEQLRRARGKSVSPLGAALMTAAVQNAAPKTAADVTGLVAAFDGKDIELLLHGLGKAAPEAGIAWALDNNKPLAALATSWVDYDARSAMQRLLALPRGAATDAAVREILAKAAQSAPAEAIEAAVKVSMPANERAKHLSAAARVLARSDPAQAILGLGRIPDAPPEEVSAVLAISGRSDAKAAAAALAQTDLNTNGYIAAESLTRGWAVADPSGASEWVRTLPKGELRDGGAAGLARSVMESDPSAAFTWAMEINDGAIRDKVALQAVNELRRTQTLAQLESDSRLSDAAREKIHDFWERSEKAPAPAVPGSPGSIILTR